MGSGIFKSDDPALRASIAKALSSWRTVVSAFRVDVETSIAACLWPMARRARGAVLVVRSFAGSRPGSVN